MRLRHRADLLQYKPLARLGAEREHEINPLKNLSRFAIFHQSNYNNNDEEDDRDDFEERKNQLGSRQKYVYLILFLC